MSTTRDAAVAALKAFGVAYRSEGETAPNTVRLWHTAMQAQRNHRLAAVDKGEVDVG